MPELPGKLYLVATPLGNLEDITFRALRILAEVDLIAAEDTRHTLKLLNHFQIKKSLISYYQHNERSRTDQLLQKIQAGADIALVSDAGMPGISDPGNLLVAEAVRQGITVIPIPGPTALISALAASGLNTGSFWFEGFLPRKNTERRAKLLRMVEYEGTLVFYEAPHRLKQTLEAILEILGDRPAVLARELTKIHEEFIRDRLSEVLGIISRKELKGEFTILIGGQTGNKTEDAAPEPGAKECNEGKGNDPLEYIKEINPNSPSLRSELKKIAQKCGRSTREIYQLYLRENSQKK
ncbi:MAG TPA: 16S rRNA (cytidine(1402)-2'-O)-methyltransferase [Bacillota bacterium]|nr:16S rRNA (cytidine(1402)-2'-O)-methyltransferase [Bacillota bacterium]